MLSCNRNCQFVSRLDPSYENETFRWLPRVDKLFLCLEHGNIHSCAKKTNCIQDTNHRCTVSGRLVSQTTSRGSSSTMEKKEKKKKMNKMKKKAMKTWVPGVTRLTDAQRTRFGFSQFRVNMEGALLELLQGRVGQVENTIASPRIQKILFDLQGLMKSTMEKDVKKMKRKATQHEQHVSFNKSLTKSKLRFDDMCNLLAEDIVTSHSDKLKLAKARGKPNAVITRAFREKVQNILLVQRLE